ncbi:MAG: methanogen output domain 1-containing protein [Methylococcales bacterium]|nr:methanogen output domain 1-containing protein [Methylococcales bacterium]
MANITLEGSRQEQLLGLLLTHRVGLSIDIMAAQLSISRNAVKQHLSTLEQLGLVQAGELVATKGRPSRQYLLTEAGINHFTKQYSWFGNLLLTELKEEMGEGALRQLMTKMGRKLAQSLAPQFQGKSTRQRVELLVQVMTQLGYLASVEPEHEDSDLKAINCVFHDLAQKNPELCEFDRALIGAALDKPIEQLECMAQGGQACRFQVKTFPIRVN